ncbi:MAG: FAD-binding oxidoreductase, partial [Symploca sp. SIO1B1]|nr:FAD-binding oxidoreductase [Symploca sp. SIO1B1]
MRGVSITQTLEPIVSTSGICDWGNLKASLQEQIAKTSASDKTFPIIAYPNTVTELSQVMNQCYGNGWRVIPCGKGSKLGWGGVGQEVDLIISTDRLNRIIDHAVGDLTVTAEAGVKFSDLQKLLSQTGQFLPLEPAYPEEATLGGIIATANSGSWRQRYGGVRDLLLGISFVRSDGEIAKAGGRVVKNVAGYDLMKLFTGSYGSLGILTEVTFRVYPLLEAGSTVVLTGEANAVASTSKTLLASALTPTAVDILSTRLVKTLGIGKGMGLMIRFQSVTEAVKEQSSRILAVGQQLGLTGTLYTDAEELNLWQSLPKHIWEPLSTTAITCKIGVLPTAAANTLVKLDQLTDSTGLGLIHAG